MRRWRRAAVASALALAACVPVSLAASPAQATDAADATDSADRVDQRLMLMLRVPPPRYRPDASYGGYLGAPGRAARRRVAQALADAHGLRLVDDWPMAALGVDCFVLEADSPQARARELPRLAADPRVESVQAVQRFRSLASDPLAAAQPATRDWRLPELHAFATGRGVTLAVVDSGADVRHPDLRGRRIRTRNFVDGSAYAAEAHGTAVTGIIGAGAGDGIGIAGIAPQARLLSLRACTQPQATAAADCDSFSLAKALQFALDAKTQVLNLSLTGPSDALLARLLDVALTRDTVVVAAFDAAAADGGFPASHRGVLTVSGLRQTAATLPPGLLRAADRGIPAPHPDGGWTLVSGDSFAAAQVSGLVALLRELSPRLGPAEAQRALAPPLALGLPAGRPTPVDACAAVEQVRGRCACGCPPARAGTGVPRR